MPANDPKTSAVTTLEALAALANYSFMDSLNHDPDAKADGADHAPRQVFSGHYVPVAPTPIENPEYVAHSKALFRELGLDDSLAQSADFMAMFSGDLTHVPEPCARSAGPPAMRCLSTAPNTISSARFRPVTATAMVARYLCWRRWPTASAGKCS